MAKQSGIHQLRGKFGGNVYYSQKGVDGGLVRKINEGMSSRVKNDAAFANTRLNAREFGSAGSFSGAAIRSISKRWRTMLNPFATGDLGRYILALMKRDSTNPWGERCVNMETLAEYLFGQIPTYAKNQYSENFALGINYTDTVDDGLVITGTTTAQTSEGLKGKGAEGVIYEYYTYSLEAPIYVPDAQKYIPGVSSVFPLGSVDAEIGQVVDLGLSKPLVHLTPTSSDFAECILVVTLPYKVVNNEKYTLQELCSFTMIYHTNV